MFEKTKEVFGSVNVLVNNAGVFQFEPFEAITEKEFHREFDINVLGTILATQEALRYFPSSGGSIIMSLLRHQGRHRYGYKGAGERARTPEHPRQYRGAGAGRYRGQPR
jgi:NAD(P)-dependent dehydrogenase (short-subunit alcohol dehydrogenase family)